MTAATQTTPYWSETPFPRFAKLEADTDVDVVVVGAGVTGLTAAYTLLRAGRSVLVMERGRCVTGDTGYTSAHLTMVTDTRLPELVKRFGNPHAQAVWDAGLGYRADRRDRAGAPDRRRLRVGRGVPPPAER